MKVVYSILLIFIGSGSIHAQSFQIQKFNEVKEFGKDRLMEIRYNNYHEQSSCDYCSYISVYGFLDNVSMDSIRMQVLSTKDRKSTKDSLFQIQRSYKPNINYTTISKSEIFFLEDYKSPKSNKWRKTSSIIGGMLVFTGIASGLSALLVDGSSNQRNLLISAGAQIVLGMTLTMTNKRKRYYFIKDSDDPWKIR